MNVCLKAAVPEDKEPMRNLLEKWTVTGFMDIRIWTPIGRMKNDIRF